MGKPDDLTKRQLKQLMFDLYGAECIWCGWKPGTPFWLTFEHLFPKEFGGTDDIENLRPACLECNNDRQTWYEWALGRCKRQRSWSRRLKRFVTFEELSTM